MLWGHKAPLCPSLPDALVARSASPVVNRPPAGSGDGGRSPHPARSGGWLALAAGEHMALVYVLGTTGLRFGEAAELRWRDVDFAGLRLRVTRSVTFVSGHPVVGTPKNGKDRTVALPATVARMLAPGADDALVVPDSAGGWMRGSNVRRRWWAKALSDAGLPTDFKLRELRHTAARLAIRSGANIKALQNMLGHASADLTLDRYGQLYQSDVDTVGQAIDAEITVTCGHGVGTGHAVGPSPTGVQC